LLIRLNVVILAAGKGTRMYSDLPKVLHPLAGKPLLGHALTAARQLGPNKVCVVFGYGGNALPQALNDSSITWVQQAQQLGTGHALMQALPELDNVAVCLVLYGDVPLIRHETLAELVALARGGAFGLLTAEMADPTGYGRIVRSADGAVTHIVEHKDATDAERGIHEINTGILAVPAGYLGRWLPSLSNQNAQGEYYLTDIIAMAVNEGLLVATCHPRHDWEIMGVNSKTQLAELERIFQGETARALLEKGVSLADPARIDVRGELVCGRDVSIDVNCVFEGAVSLADKVSVGANCVLRNVSVGPGTTILPFSHLDDAVVGADNHIGPFARIRPGTRLEASVHVGNFVEIKNSQVDQGSKINHLSYIGDSSIGKKVNIGAGTITCNYDGANKHRTIIEDDVFVGSDTQLVAPVTVARGTTIGAGSTITRDTPAGELTLSRVKQTTITGWKRPEKTKK
jgi:bifunctional UDP-N-acetylglucosamine pyrophosphorylase/glucosamine-1-phosphate N-acetyltransferase